MSPSAINRRSSRSIGAHSSRPTTGAMIEMLTEGVHSLCTSSRWRDHLTAQSRFHNYSYGNVLLIGAQCPNATQIAGFRAWKGLDRSVIKGEKAIWILAPMRSRESRASKNSSDRSEIALSGASFDGARSGASPIPHRDPRHSSAVLHHIEVGEVDGELLNRPSKPICGFRPVPVFDIKQTEGQPLPIVCRRLEGDGEVGVFENLIRLANDRGFHVEDHDFDDGTNGDCSHQLHRIRVESRNGPRQRIKTLAHELAHACLHAEIGDRARAELEAESVAFVVCRSIGIDSGDYSFGYLATWSGSGEKAAEGIRRSCAVIQATASAIVDGLSDLPLGGGTSGFEINENIDAGDDQIAFLA